jgi:riboflavin biosynthesis pyrimidine reductase
VRALLASADRDVGIAGPTLAAHAFAAGLVDECWCVVVPVLVGGGLRALPDDVRLDLELTEERRFTGGSVFLRYAVRR